MELQGPQGCFLAATQHTPKSKIENNNSNSFSCHDTVFVFDLPTTLRRCLRVSYLENGQSNE